MPDILVRHIDDQLAERIKTLARERNWTINEVILHALRFGLGLSGDDLEPHEPELQDVARLAGTWDATETRAFDAALSALDEAPSGQFANRDDEEQED